jgi:hypothetical protein
MNKHLLTPLFALASLLGAGPQAGPVNVKLRVLLVDRDRLEIPGLRLAWAVICRRFLTN